MTALMNRAAKAARHAKSAPARLRRARPLDSKDEAEMAALWDREHGMELSRKERSKRRYDLGEGAPIIKYTPPQLRE